MVRLVPRSAAIGVFLVECIIHTSSAAPITSNGMLRKIDKSLQIEVTLANVKLLGGDLITEPQMILLMLFGITGIFWMRSHQAKAPIQWSVGLFSTESIRRRADNFMRIADAACELHLIEKFQHLDGEVTADF